MQLNNGGLNTLAILLPNLLWALFPPPAAGNKPKASPTIARVEIFEQIGRAGTILIPFFYNFHIETVPEPSSWA